jgi:hypothetical protein
MPTMKLAIRYACYLLTSFATVALGLSANELL